jgi:hypothetical protein
MVRRGCICFCILVLVEEYYFHNVFIIIQEICTSCLLICPLSVAIIATMQRVAFDRG